MDRQAFERHALTRKLTRRERDAVARYAAIDAFNSGRPLEVVCLRLACAAHIARDKGVADALALAACAFIHAGNA